MRQICKNVLVFLDVSLLGSWIVPANVTVTDSPAIYTTGAYCDTALNYTVAYNGTVSVCIWMSTKNSNFTMAVASCQSKNMHLVTPKRIEKVNILTTIALKLNKGFWVGLNDMEVEDVFRWVDDGTLLDAAYRKQIFGPGQPDNFNNSEDCVGYSLKYPPLNDGPCSSSAMFICEKNISVF
ncbi:hypothetical protein Btru_057243 [Bulinus truncatus]|nr:hypothetical protein Btru_057243 [Bulinus truncatus]